MDTRAPEEIARNNQMHRTATSRCGFEATGLFGHWTRSRSPVPVEVGDIGRWASMRFVFVSALLLLLAGCVPGRERFDRDMEQHYEVQCGLYYSVYASSDIEGAKKALDELIALSLAEKSKAKYYWRFDTMIAFAQARLAVIAEYQGDEMQAGRLFSSASDYQLRGDEALRRDMGKGGTPDDLIINGGFTPEQWRKAVAEIDENNFHHVRWKSPNKTLHAR